MPKSRLVNEKEIARTYRIKTTNNKKLILMNILGGPICVICGITDIRCLQFDHINGDGYKERHEKNIKGNTTVRYYLKHKEEAIQKLQVLCANCNWIKRHENKESRNNKNNLIINSNTIK